MLPIIVIILPVLLALFWASPASLKLRIAVELMGWEGLMKVTQASIAQRVLGARETHSRTAFHEFLDATGNAELKYLVPQRRVMDPTTIAEGHRLFSHLIQTGLRVYYEADLDRPHFSEMVSPFNKVLGDNPDAFYYTTMIRRDGSYVIKGKHTGEDYLSFTIYEASCVGCFSQRVLADVNDRQMIFDKDGSYSITVSPSPTAAFTAGKKINHLSLAACSSTGFPQIITRHYFERELAVQLNATARIQELSIVPTHVIPPRYPGRLTDQESAERWGRVSAFITSHTTGMEQDPTKAPKWFSFTPNVFGPPTLFRAENAGELGAVDIAYSGAPFKLEDVNTQGLVITGKMPPCVFANVALWNVFLQTLSYERGNPVSLNRKQLKSLDKVTNRFRIVLSKVRPTSRELLDADWLFSEGRSDGTLFFRFLLPEGEIETPKAQVVKVVG